MRVKQEQSQKPHDCGLAARQRVELHIFVNFKIHNGRMNLVLRAALRSIVSSTYGNLETIFFGI